MNNANFFLNFCPRKEHNTHHPESARNISSEYTRFYGLHVSSYIRLCIEDTPIRCEFVELRHLFVWKDNVCMVSLYHE